MLSNFAFKMACREPLFFGLFLKLIGIECYFLFVRELSMQTFGVLRELLKHHYHTYGLIMGGANRNSEAQKLAKGNHSCHSLVVCFLILVLPKVSTS